MNLFTKIPRRLFARWTGGIYRRPLSERPLLTGEKLTERSLIRVQGGDVIPYLQGLVTNDMGHFERDANIMYAMLLNNTGRVLYDTLIYRTGEPEVFLVDCDKTAVNEVKRHLRQFRVRRKIDIDCVGTEYYPWAVYHTPKIESKCNEEDIDDIKESFNENIILDLNTDFSCEEILACQDPRVRALGFRVVMPKAYSFAELGKLFSQHKLEESTPATSYRKLRYSLGVGEGIQDHPPNKCFPLESNCDFLHGVSFHKGCYIGQELTARVHHTGVIRKRLMPIKLTKKLEEGPHNIQTVAGTVIGSLRGFTDNAGLALIRVEQAVKMPNLMIDGDRCTAIIPYWWPKELPTKNMVREKQAENV